MKGTLHFGTNYTKKHAAERGSKQSNFPLGVESNTGVHSFCFSPLCDWSGEFEPPSKPIKCKSLNKRVFVTPIFPRFRQCALFTLSFHRLLVIFHLFVIGCCGYRGFGITTLNRKARYLLAMVHGVGGDFEKVSNPSFPCFIPSAI